jgi:hypothetical protein
MNAHWPAYRANPTRPSDRLTSVEVLGASLGSGSPTKVGLEIVCLPLPPIIGGPMLIFAFIAGGLIIACTVFALFVPSGPVVTLSDIARQMETLHRSQPLKRFDIACAAKKREAKVSGQVKRFQ